MSPVVSRRASYPQVETGSPRAWRAAVTRLRCGGCPRRRPVRVCVAWRRVPRARARGPTDRAGSPGNVTKLPGNVRKPPAGSAFDELDAIGVY